MGMFLRRGPAEKPVQTVDVIISGDTNADYAYVEIDGTKYTATGTYAIPVGAAAVVHCYNALGQSGANVSKITFNGTTVQTANYNRQMITYSFSLKSSTSIAFSVKDLMGTAKNYSCNITTN